MLWYLTCSCSLTFLTCLSSSWLWKMIFTFAVKESWVFSSLFILQLVASSLNQDWIQHNWNLWFLFYSVKLTIPYRDWEWMQNPCLKLRSWSKLSRASRRKSPGRTLGVPGAQPQCLHLFSMNLDFFSVKWNYLYLFCLLNWNSMGKMLAIWLL